MKPEPLEIERLRREVVKLKAERDILKRPQPTLPGTRYEVRVHCKAPFDLAMKRDRGMALRSAGGFSFRFPCLAQSFSERRRPL
jgi:transposase